MANLHNHCQHCKDKYQNVYDIIKSKLPYFSIDNAHLMYNVRYTAHVHFLRI